MFLDGTTTGPTRGGIWLQITNLNAVGGSARVRAGFANGLAAPNSAVKEWRSDFVLPKDTWMHVVVVFTNANTVQFYVNGTSITTPFLTGTATNIGWAGQNAIIGLANNYGIIGSADPTYEGVIDETYIWNRAISQAEITELYNSNNGKQYPN